MINNFKMGEKRGQVTIFIILAIVIVLAVVLFLVLRPGIEEKVPQELEPVYTYYLSCLESDVSIGSYILGQQGGYIEAPEFSPGSEYMPFSNQLAFLGTGVPYWYYISGNGVVKEQVPGKAKMQSQLDVFLEERALECDFSQFVERGFEIDIGVAEVKSVLKEGSISVNVEQDFTIIFGETSWTGKNHKLEISSNLGKFYDLAEKIYLNNKESMFLENYGVDILRLYAPVDGSEIGCSPKIWFVSEIRDDLIGALEANVPSTKLKGDYYNLGKAENKYFVRDIGEDVNVNVNFMYQRSWPMKMEIWPSEDDILRADPVGLQQGLGMLGFCYVPYHFVYDFAYPVLIQLYSESEMFQFPVVVYINKNHPREPLEAEGLPDVVPELCQYKNTELTVYTYNTNLEPLEADIRFKCFDTSCYIGKTEGSDAVLTGDFPQCVNGYIFASAEGYETKKELVSSVSESTVEVFLTKKYKLDLEVQKAGDKADYAVVTLTKEDGIITLAYPEQEEIELTAGQYEIKVYVYSNSSINLEGESVEKCVDVPKSGVFGVFGLTEKKCFTMEIPDQVVSFAVSGGGVESYYVGESELQDSNKLIISAEDFGIPRKVEDLQINYNNVEVNRLDINFE